MKTVEQIKSQGTGGEFYQVVKLGGKTLYLDRFDGSLCF